MEGKQRSDFAGFVFRSMVTAVYTAAPRWLDPEREIGLIGGDYVPGVSNNPIWIFAQAP